MRKSEFTGDEITPICSLTNRVIANVIGSILFGGKAPTMKAKGERPMTATRGRPHSQNPRKFTILLKLTKQEMDFLNKKAHGGKIHRAKWIRAKLFHEL